MESTQSLYGAHNFIVIAGEQNFGLFVDHPAKVTFDIGYTCSDILEISCQEADDIILGQLIPPAKAVLKADRSEGRGFFRLFYMFGHGLRLFWRSAARRQICTSI